MPVNTRVEKLSYASEIRFVLFKKIFSSSYLLGAYVIVSAYLIFNELKKNWSASNSNKTSVGLSACLKTICEKILVKNQPFFFL